MIDQSTPTAQDQAVLAQRATATLDTRLASVETGLSTLISRVSTIESTAIADIRSELVSIKAAVMAALPTVERMASEVLTAVHARLDAIEQFLSNVPAFQQAHVKFTPHVPASIEAPALNPAQPQQ